jgi:hypothetical protein
MYLFSYLLTSFQNRPFCAFVSREQLLIKKVHFHERCFSYLHSSAMVFLRTPWRTSSTVPHVHEPHTCSQACHSRVQDPLYLAPPSSPRGGELSSGSFSGGSNLGHQACSLLDTAASEDSYAPPSSHRNRYTPRLCKLEFNVTKAEPCKMVSLYQTYASL